MAEALTADSDSASRPSSGHPVFDFISGMTDEKFECQMDAELHILGEARGKECALGHAPRDVLAKVRKRGWIDRDAQGKIVLRPTLDCY